VSSLLCLGGVFLNIRPTSWHGFTQTADLMQAPIPMKIEATVLQVRERIDSPNRTTFLGADVVAVKQRVINEHFMWIPFETILLFEEVRILHSSRIIFN
jgi:hypothetical protein